MWPKCGPDHKLSCAQTRSFVGPQAVRSVEAHFTDHVLFSVRGLADAVHLTDPDPLEAEVKRSMIRRARQAVLLAVGWPRYRAGFREA